MKKLMILALMLSSNAFALTFEINNVCDEDGYLRENIEVLLPTNVAHISLYVFDTFEIPYSGTERSIHSIFNTPTGIDSIQVMGRGHIRIYDWCYEVDGVRPSIKPHHYAINPYSDSELKWYYGYYEQIDGKWTSAYCKPVTAEDKFICDKISQE